MTSFRSQIESDLSYLRDTCISAARDRQFGILDDGLSVCYELTATFLEEMSRAGIRYDREIAEREQSSISGSWAEMEALNDAYRAILDASIDTGDLAVIDGVMHFPIRVAALSLQYGDYYVFNMFIRWIPYVYFRSAQIPVENTRKYVVDRSGRFLQELLAYSVTPWIRDDLTRVAEGYSEYVYGVEKAFGELLKEAIDHARIRDACFFSAQLDMALQSLDYGLDDHVGRRTPAASDNSVPGPADAGALRRQSRRTQQLMELATVAWGLHLVATERLAASDWWDFVDCCHLPADASGLWNLYLTALDLEFKDEFDWRIWELSERPEGVGYAVAFGSYLAQATAALMLRAPLSVGSLLRAEPEDVHLLKPEGDFARAIESLSDSELQVLLSVDQANVELLRQIAEESVTAVERDFTVRLVEAPISEARIARVLSNVATGWQESATFRKLLNRVVQIQPAGDPPAGLQAFGLKAWDLKEIYAEVEGSILHSVDWGVEYGRSLGRGEDEACLSHLVGDSDGSPPTGGLHEVDDWVRQQGPSSYPAIVVVGSWVARQALSLSSEFAAVDTSLFGRDAEIGTYRSVPVLNLYSDKFTGILLLDAARAIDWRQFLPVVATEGRTWTLDGGASFNLQQFDAQEARQLAETRPNLRRWRDKSLSIDSAAVEIQQHVHISLFEWFEVRPGPPGSFQVLTFLE